MSSVGVPLSADSAASPSATVLRPGAPVGPQTVTRRPTPRSERSNAPASIGCTVSGRAVAATTRSSIRSRPSMSLHAPTPIAANLAATESSPVST